MYRVRAIRLLKTVLAKHGGGEGGRKGLTNRWWPPGGRGRGECDKGEKLALITLAVPFAKDGGRFLEGWGGKGERQKGDRQNQCTEQGVISLDLLGRAS